MAGRLIGAQKWVSMENEKYLIIVKVKRGAIMGFKKGVTGFLKRLFGVKEAESRFKDPRRGYDNYVMQTGPIAEERRLEIEQEKKVRKFLKKTRVIVVAVPVTVSSQDHSGVYASAACAVACDAGTC